MSTPWPWEHARSNLPWDRGLQASRRETLIQDVWQARRQAEVVLAWWLAGLQVRQYLEWVVRQEPEAGASEVR